MDLGKQNIFIQNEQLLSARKAAKRLSCAPDYVSKLCREGKLEGVRQNGAWFVSPAAIQKFEKTRAEARAVRAQELSELRRQENQAFKKEKVEDEIIPAPTEISSVFNIFGGRRVVVAFASMLLFAALVSAAGAADFGGIFAKNIKADQAAALAQIKSPFFGNHTFSISSSGNKATTGNFFSALLALFTPKQAVPVATAPVTTPVVTQPVTTPLATTATSTKTTTVVQNNTYPIVERTIERAVSGITAAEVDAKLSALDNSIRTLLFTTITSAIGSLPSSGGFTNNIALSQRIDRLDGVVITNATITGSTVNGFSTFGGGGGSGTVDGTGAADLFAYWVDTDTLGATSSPTVGTIIATSTTASSTFAGGIFIGGSIQTNIAGCTEALETNAAGFLVCGTDQTALGAANPFIWTPNFGVVAAATSSPFWAQSGIFASSTSQFANANFINATTSSLYIGSLSGLLSATNGSVGTIATNTLGLLGSSSISATAPLTYTQATGVFAISQSGLATDGYLSSTDFNTFNNKISSSSLSAGAGINYNSTTGVITNTGVTSLVAGNGITISGSTGAVTVTNTIGYAFPGNATTTQIAFNGGLMATTLTAANILATGSTTLQNFTANNATTSQATTTNLAITGISSALLKTLSSGAVVAATPGVDYATVGSGAFPFTPATNFGVNTSATSTALWAQAGIFASSTSQFADTTILNATTTSLAITGILSCSGTSALTTNSSGTVVCGAISGTGGASFPFTPTQNFGVNTSATTTALFAQSGIFASSTSRFAEIITASATTTVLSVTSSSTIAGTLNAVGGATFGGATSTTFAITGISGSLLKTLSSGAIVAATAGTDYATPSQASFPFTPTTSFGAAANATSTLVGFNAGLYALGSSTIGGGTAATGLTISGNATTTGLLNILGSGTSTIASNILISGNIVPSLNNTYYLGAPGQVWHSVYLGPGSLYVNGQKVISTNGGDDVVISSDPNENLVVQTSGSANIELNPTGGQVQIKNTINITAGKSITTTDLSALSVPSGVAAGNLTVSGNAITATNLNGGISFTPNGSGGTYVTIGNFGVGSTTPISKLSVSGDGYITGGLGIGTVNTSAGTLVTTGNATVGGTLRIGGTTSCTGSQALQTDGSGNVSCGSISVSGSSAAGGWSTNNVGRVALSTTTDLVVVGASTTPYAKFAVLSGATGTTTLALVPATSQTANILDIYNTSGVLSSVLTAGGNFGLGTTSPSATLGVQGSALISGNLTVAGVTATGTISSANFIASASSTIAGQFNAVGGALFGNATTSSLYIGSLTGLLYGLNGQVGTIATATLGLLSSTSIIASAPLSWNSSTGALSISQSGLATDGYLSSTDFNTFNNKISSSSLSAGAGINYNSTTGVITNIIGYAFPNNATSTLLSFTGGLISASSTSFNLFATNSTSTNATTTNLAITGISSALLKTLSSGAVVAAVEGTDYLTSAFVFAYPFIGDATSTTLTFSGGLVSNGSTTVAGLSSGLVGNNNGLLYSLATSTNFVTSLAAGNGISLSGTAGAVTVTNTIGYPFPSNATTTQIAFNGGLTATNAAFTNATSTNATTTNFAITGVTSSILKTLSSGAIVAATQGVDYVTNAELFAWPFTPTTNFGVNTSATSTPIFAQSGVFASSTSRFAGIITLSATTTLLSVTSSSTIAGQLNAVGGATFGNFTGTNSTTTNATSTNFAITGLTADAGQCLTITAAGSVVTQSCQSGSGAAAFSFLNNFDQLAAATSSTLWAQNGIFASSTSRFAGISTISATTTNLLSTGSTTVAGQFNAVGGATLGALTSGASTMTSLSLGTALAAGSGGTGLSSPAAAGILIGTYGGGGWQQFATSSLGINFADVTGTATDEQVSNSLTITAGSIDGAAIGANSASTAIFTNATTTNFYINGTVAGAGLTSCSASVDKLLWNATTRQFSCGTDTGGAGGADNNWTFFNNSGVRLATSTNQVLIGDATHTSTSTLAKLEVWGGAIFDSATSTSSYTSGQAIFGGRVGIGTTSPTELLSVVGGNILQVASGNPGLASTTLVGGQTYASYVVGNYVYVAAGSAGLKILNIANPKAPVVLGTYSSGITSARSVVVAGKYAYLADTGFGVRILDVSNASAPSLVGSYSIGAGSAYSLALSGSHLFVANFNGSSVLSINVSNPAAPTLAATYAAGGNPVVVTVAGKYLYIATYSPSLRVVDISDPTNPTTVSSSYSTNMDTPTGIYASGEYVYLTDELHGLSIVNVNNPASPSLTGSYKPVTPTNLNDVRVAGDYAYTTDRGNNNFLVIDVRSPTAPSLVGSYAISDSPAGVTLAGKYAYVGNESTSLNIIDINGATLPAANIGSLAAGILTVTDNLNVGGGIYTAGGINSGLNGIFTRGGLTALGSSTIGASLSVVGSTTIGGVFNSVSSNLLGSTTLLGNSLFSNATTSSFAITGVSGSLLKTLSSGAVVAATAGVDYALGGAANDFTWASNFGTLAAATSSAIWAQSGIFASSTSQIASTTFALNGNVGIGTSTPTSKLHVDSTAGLGPLLTLSSSASGATTEMARFFSSYSGSDTRIGFTFYDNSEYAAALQSVRESSGTNWGLGLLTGSGSSSSGPSERLRITSTGNLGLGTTSPWGKLSINNSTNDTAGQPLFVVASSTASATTTAFIITNTGYVGIGTTTPASPLHISSLNSSNDWVTLDRPGSRVWSINATNGGFNIYDRGLSGSSANNVFSIAQTTGNVGIGSTTPTAKLSVQGGALISGDVFAANITATGTATTTNLAVTSVTSSLLKTNALGQLIAAVAGTDYVTGAGLSSAFPFTPTTNFGVNTSATSTALWAQSGIFASSTSQFAGISTISATTTNLLATGSTTIAGQLNAVSGATLGSLTAGATTLSILTLGSLTGPLQAIGGVVSATSTLSTTFGGTGISTSPTLGQILVGNNTGTYTLFATSSLGLLSSTSIIASAPLSWNSSTGALSISQSGTGADGYLSSTNFNTFNNKISSTSLSAGAGINYNSTTGVITNTIGYSFVGNATSTLIAFNGGLTATNATFTNSTSTNATTTNLAITAVTNALLKTLPSGAVVAAIAGTDYLTSANVAAFPFTPTTLGNSTSTRLIFTNGAIASASSTIGDGTQTDGLTISGGATTTGNAYIGGTLSIGTPFGIGQLTNQNGSITDSASGTGLTGANSINWAMNTGGYVAGFRNNSSVSNANGLIVRTTGTATTNKILTLNSNGVDVLSAGGNGNLGLGSTTPWGKLSINNSTNDTARQPLFVVASSTDSATTTVFVINNNGNVGIGIASPQNLFQIAKDSTYTSESSAALSIRSASTDSELLLGADATNDVGYIQAMQDGTSWTTRDLALQPNGGRVGIGTTSPLSPLYVKQNLATSLGGLAIESLIGSNTGRIYIDANGTFNLQRGTNDGQLSLANSGNVGIGTTSPYAKLSVGGDIVGTNLTATGTLTVVGNTTLANATSTNFAITGITSSLLKTLSSGAVVAAVAGTDYLTSANVAAFPFTPTTAFGTAANATSTLIGFTNGIYATASSTFTSSFNVLGVGYFAGNLGLASSSPNSRLVVNGNTRITSVSTGSGIFADNGGTVGIFSLTRQDTVTTGDLSIAAFGGIGFKGGSQSYNNAVASGYSLYIASAGNIGVGTTTPWGKLSINNSTNDTAGQPLFVVASSTASATTTVFSIDNTGRVAIGTSTLPRAQLAVQGNVGIYKTDSTIAFELDRSGAKAFSLSASSNHANLIAENNFVFITGNTSGLNSNQNGSEQMRLTTAGNLGIGTTTPAERLSVQGGALISGNAFFGGSITSTSSITGANLSSTGSTTVAGAFNSVSSNLLGSTTLLGNSLLSNATTTTFAITSVSNALLKTLSSGAVVAAVAGTDYLTSANVAAFPFTPTTYGNSTSTTIGFLNGLLSVGSTTINGNATTTGSFAVGGNAIFSGNIGVGTTSPSKLLNIAIGNATNLSNGLLVERGTGGYSGAQYGLKSDASGIYRGAISVFTSSGVETEALSINTSSTYGAVGNVGIGSTSPYAKLSVGGDIVGANLTATGTLTVAGNTSLQAATSTTFAITGITSSLLKTLSSGAVVAAVAGTDYLTSANVAAFPFTSTTNFGALANATSTAIWFQNGLQASSTSRLSSVTVNGTLGFLATTSNATSTLATLNGVVLLTASTTGFNTSLGLNAFVRNTSGIHNVAIGESSLNSNTTGRWNNAVGSFALSVNTTGSSNTAFGDSALSSNRTGSNNVAIGYNALAFGNATSTVALGSEAGYGSQTEDTGSVYLGHRTGWNLTGSQLLNTFVGYQAGYNITSGKTNLLLGASVAGNLTTGSNNIIIGNSAFATSSSASNSLNIGGILFGTLPATSTAFKLPTTGSVGIATSSPFATFGIHANNGSINTTLFAIGSSTQSATTTLFSVSNGGNVSINAPLTTDANRALNIIGVDYQLAIVNASNNRWGLSNWDGTNGLYFQYNGVNKLFLGSTGSLGVGSSTPFARLSVDTTGLSTGVPEFSVGSSSRQDFIILQSGFAGVGTTSPSTNLAVQGNSLVSGTSTVGGLFATSTLQVATLTQASCDVKATTAGVIFCGTDATGSGSSPFTFTTNFGVITAATTSPLWAQNGIFASSTSRLSSLTVDGTLGFLATTTNATSTLATLNGATFLTASSTAYNTGLGINALLSNTRGAHNTAVGSNALASTTSGLSNTAIGSLTLYNNLTGSANSALGYGALYNNTSGSFNSVSGFESMYANTTGQQNIAQGYHSLHDNITGSYNVALGMFALFSATSTNGQVAVGYDALRFATSSTGQNTAVGYQSLRRNDSGYRNTALGYLTLTNNLTGSFNAAVGTRALAFNTTGSDNVAVGDSALNANTTGSNNTAIGDSALISNITGGNNVAVGANALGTGNSTSTTALGADAGYGFQTGDFGSNYIGYRTGWNLTGSQLHNNYFGWLAGYNVTSGWGNTLIGASSSPNLITGSNNIIIGNNALATSSSASRMLNIGGILFGLLPATSTQFMEATSGSIGIATSSPFATFGIHANNGSTNTTLFAIGSSTASATSTLFSINNVGSTTIRTLAGASCDVKADVAGVLYCGTDATGSGSSPFTYSTNFGVLTAATTSPIWAQGGLFASSTSIIASTTFAANGSVTIAPDLTVASSTPGGTARLAALEVQGNIVSKGTTWTAQSGAGNDDAWYAVTYGNGLFVAISYFNDRVMTSPDGVNWTARSAAGNNDDWFGVTYGNGLFVAISYFNDRVMTSPDGVNWTARSAAGNNDDWFGVTYGNGLFVAVGTSGDRVMTSPDGVNWTARSAAGNDDSWVGITYGNGLFVGVANSGTDRVMSSPDGINWTARSAAGNDDSWIGITYGNGLFVAVGDGIGSDKIMTSGHLDFIPFTANNTFQGGMQIFGNVGIGSSTPTSRFAIETQAGDLVGLAVGSSTKTLISVSTEGFGTTTLAGLNVLGAATSTSNVGFNITSGCFAVNGTCVGGGGAFNNTIANGGTATTTFYDGGVVFSDGTKLTQSDAAKNFFWDELNDRLGLGTSSPMSKLTVEQDTEQFSFVIGNQGSSTPSFVVTGVNGNGMVGIGTSSPSARLAIQGAVADTSGLFNVSTSGGVTAFHVTSSGTVGVGTTTPSTIFSIQDAVATAQQTIAYDNNNYTSFLVNAAGDLSITPSGKDAFLIDSNFFVCQGGACPTAVATSTSGNLFVENAVTIGSGFSLKEIDSTNLGLYNATGELMIIFDNGI